MICARGQRPTLTENIKLINQFKNQANGCSTCSCWCPEFEDSFLFEIRQKWLSYGPKHCAKNEQNRRYLSLLIFRKWLLLKSRFFSNIFQSALILSAKCTSTHTLKISGKNIKNVGEETIRTKHIFEIS